MKKVVFVTLDQFPEWESAYLASALTLIGNGKYENVFASLTADPVFSIGGMKVEPGAALTACSDADALVLVGGMSWKTEVSEKVAPIVSDYWKTGKPLGAIGYAVTLLASCGLLDDVKHTTGASAQELKDWAPEKYKGEKLFVQNAGSVCDGRLVTAATTSPIEFARDMLLLCGISRIDAQEWYVFNKTGQQAAPAAGK